MNHRSYLFIKRLLDVILSVIAIVFFLIPWAVIAVVIKIQSPGPVVYRSQRIGLHGQEFTLYKFRSMRVDSGEVRITTLRNDDRIFPFGSFLRKSKLDETLQLFNILKGEMSIIGPRPEDEPHAAALFTGRYKKVLEIKPGLSSPASLFDYTYGEKVESEEEFKRKILPVKLELELYYAMNRSLSYDISMVFRTAVTIFCEVFGISQSIPKEAKKILEEGMVVDL